MDLQYKYYSTQRPIGIGTYSRKNNTSINNYDTKKFIDEIGREAWGELLYSSPLKESELEEYELVQSEEQKEFIDDINSIQENIKQLNNDLQSANDGAEIEQINNIINAMNDTIDEMKKDRIKKLENDSVTFYVDECMEFPSMGASWQNIDTIENAIKIYEQLPDETVNMGHGIGMIFNSNRKELEDYTNGKLSLYDNGDIGRILQYCPSQITENETIKNAIKVLESHFNKEPKEKINVSVESTADIDFEEKFHANMKNTNGIGREDYYRVVTINRKGLIEPYNDMVFDTQDEAKEFIANNHILKEIKYDDMIKKSRELYDERKNYEYINGIEKTEDTHREENSTKENNKLSVKEETIEKLKNGIKETIDSDKFADWCKKQGKLYMNNYSFSNAMLTYIQKPDASYVMGYEAWKTVGRQVNKGAKGIKILAPVLVKEYSKGGLLASIKKSCTKQIKEDSKLEYGSFTLGHTKLSFNMYKNGLFDVKINDDVKMAHITSDELRKFLNQYVIGKVPAYYNAVTVFDIKDTNTKSKYLWVKDGFKKEELVEENGKPIINKKGQYKIINSEERKAKFNVNIDMTIKEADENKMNILYDTLKTISKNNGIPVDEKSNRKDENLLSGALGYYRRPSENYPKGNIVISSELSITNKVSVLFHEMAHSQMHRNLDLLKKEMAEMNDKDVKITRQLKETQAEAVAYMTASNFGIETAHKSFEYIANWSNGRELQELEQSLNYIYKKSKELMKDIEKELDSRGLNLQMEAKENQVLSNEDKKNMIKEFKSYVLNENRENQEVQKNALEDYKFIISDEDTQKSIIKEQIVLTQKIDEKIKNLDNNIDKFENSNSSKLEIELRNKIQSQINQIDLLKKRIDELSEERINLVVEKKDNEKTDMKTLYVNYPIEAINKLKETYKEIADIDDIQTKFLASSKFISSYYGKFLGIDNEKFVNLASNHLKNFQEVMSKNKTVVEVSLCEQWGDTPIFKEGTLAHPKVANKIVQEAEKQVQGFKKKAEANNEYYPYTKCNLSIYSITDKNKLSVLNTRIDIGDSEQKNIVEHLEQICKGKEKQKLLENFTKSTRERGKTIMIEPIQKENDNIENKENESIESLSMENWKSDIKDYKNHCEENSEIEKYSAVGKERE